MPKKKAVKSTKKPVKKIQGVKREINIQKVSGKPTKVVIKKQIFGKAPEKKVFYLRDGRKLKSLIELTESFETMGEEVFKHHVNEMRNDFSNWIRDVFKDKELAEDIERVENKIEAQVKMLKHMVKKLSSEA